MSGHIFNYLAHSERCIPFLYIVARGPRNLPRDVWHTYLPFSSCLSISIYVLVRQIYKRGKDSVGPCAMIVATYEDAYTKVCKF